MSIAASRDVGAARAADFIIRNPVVEDGSAVWQLVCQSGALEPNTCYAYLLLCSHFAATCLVAERGAEICGFVGAYRPPSQPRTVFVWQIGVRREARGEGLGKRLLHGLVALPSCRDVTHLEATVAPSNVPSQRLFRGFARDLGARCEVGRGFDRTHFGPLGHESEDLYRIGPLRRQP